MNNGFAKHFGVNWRTDDDVDELVRDEVVNEREEGRWSEESDDVSL